MSRNEEIDLLAAKIVDNDGDYEQHHVEGDRVLIECIRYLAQLVDVLQDGHGRDVIAPTEELIAKWTALPKWYA